MPLALMRADEREESREDEAEAAVGARLDVLLARKVLMQLAGRHECAAEVPFGGL